MEYLLRLLGTSFGGPKSSQFKDSSLTFVFCNFIIFSARLSHGFMRDFEAVYSYCREFVLTDI